MSAVRGHLDTWNAPDALEFFVPLPDRTPNRCLSGWRVVCFRAMRGLLREPEVDTRCFGRPVRATVRRDTGVQQFDAASDFPSIGSITGSGPLPGFRWPSQ